MAEWLLIVTVLWKQSEGLATEWVQPMKSEASCLEAVAKWPERRQVYNGLDFSLVLGEIRCQLRADYER